MKNTHPESKTILITGAAQGIGAEIARALARKDRTLLLADIEEELLSEIASELKSKCARVSTYLGDLARD